MDILALACGFALPWILGVALLRAIPRGTPPRAGPGTLAWTVGCGWFAGAFLLTLWMRALSAAGVQFGVIAIGVPLAVVAGLAAWLAWRRDPRAFGQSARAALRVLAGSALVGGARVAWRALLGWLVLRFALLLVEVTSRPLYPWDAWSHWATKARVWFELKSMVPFVATSEWFQAGGLAYTDFNPHYPATVPLLQAWGATVLGRWDDAFVNLPWWLTGVALALAIYGFLARRGVDALWALVGAWLVISLPILDVHIALAGYADLPMAAYLTLAVLAGWRWSEERGRDDAALAVLFVVACVLIKNPGKVWVLTLLPGAVVALAPRYGLRVAMAGFAGAVAVLVVLARLDLVLLGYRLHLDFALPWRGLVDAYLLYANWHLLWYAAIAVALVGWRDLLARELAPLTLVVAAGLLFLFFGFAFTNARLWVEDQSTVNRATLHLAPLLVVWMLLAARAWMARLQPGLPASASRMPEATRATTAAIEPAAAAAPPPDFLVARALDAHQRGDLDAAESDYRAALAAAPQHPHALHYLGVILYQRDRTAEALPLLERAVALIPQEPEFHNNLGLALVAADRTAEAIAAYRRALALKPDHAVAWNNLGLALQAANELPGAIDAFRRALRLAPDFAQAHWNLGLALLGHGEFAEGWGEYDWRLAIPALGKDRPDPPGPRWDGTNPDGKTLLLTSEQGLGDTLQFVRFAAELAAMGARVLVQAQPALRNLLASVRGISGAYGTDEPLPAYDAHLPLLSVGGALGVTAANIPANVPYLAPDPKHAASIAAELEPFRGRLKVGLAWAGSRAHGNDRRRSCPLALLAPLLERRDVAWFSLQKDDGEDQIATAPAARELVLLDARRDFDRKAALIAALDLVISVDTSIAHLAGALARPVWIMLPFAPDWRWQLDRIDSPWYPTARLFRQPHAGDWSAVIESVRDALAAWHPHRGQPMIAPPPSRNDPCPCGSGLRYKHCHGRAGGAPPTAAAVPAASAGGAARS